MRSLLTTFVVLLCLFSLTLVPVSATDVGPPNQPDKLFDPDKVRMFAMGLHKGETRKWMEKFIPNDNGGIMALCIKDLIGQQIFPAAGPAVGGSMFCLADLLPIGPFQWSATVIVSIPQLGDSIKIPAKRVLKFRVAKQVRNCTILVEDGTFIPGVNTLTDPPRQHVVTCTSDDGGGSLIASLSTTGLSNDQSIGLDLPQKFLVFEENK